MRVQSKETMHLKSRNIASLPLQKPISNGVFREETLIFGNPSRISANNWLLKLFSWWIIRFYTIIVTTRPRPGPVQYELQYIIWYSNLFTEVSWERKCRFLTWIINHFGCYMTILEPKMRRRVGLLNTKPEWS